MEQPTQEQHPVYRILNEAYGTRYVELSAFYDDDCTWHGAIRRLEVAFDGIDRVTLYRLHSDEAPVKMSLTQEETALFLLATADYLLKEGDVGQYQDVAVIDASIVTLTKYLEALQAMSHCIHVYEEQLDPLESADESDCKSTPFLTVDTA